MNKKIAIFIGIMILVRGQMISKPKWFTNWFPYLSRE